MNKEDRKEFTEFKGDINAQIAPIKKSVDNLSKWGVWFFKIVGGVIIVGIVSSIVADYNESTKPYHPRHEHSKNRTVDKSR